MSQRSQRHSNANFENAGAGLGRLLTARRGIYADRMSEDRGAAGLPSDHPLAQLLAAADDEKAVISVIADRDADGRWRLRHATCLIAPEDCADQSWAAWLGATGT